VRGSQARLVRVLGRYEPHAVEDDVDAWPADEVPTWVHASGAEPAQTFSAGEPAQTFAAGGPAPAIIGRPAQTFSARGSAQTFSAVEAWTPALLPAATPAWGVEMLAGRLVELCGWRGSAVLTSAIGLVLDAQRRGEPVAWIAPRHDCFYPPDAAANGVDLAALVVVRPPDAAQVPRAADQLARSGAFGLLVLDLGTEPRVPVPVLARLLGLAQKHAVAIVCLSEKPPAAASLGSLVSLRADVERVRRAPGTFACTLRVTKDKRRAPGWEHAELCQGPMGFR
jgi:recombination protein RecA